MSGGTPLATAFVRLRADDSGFQADADGKIARPLQHISERGKAAFSALAGIIGQSGAFAPLSGAIDAVSQGLDYIQQNGRRTGTVLIGAGAAAAAAGALLVASSKKDVEAHAQLKQAIENSGHAYEPYAKRVEEAVHGQERFGHTADDVQQAIRRLTEATGDPTKAIAEMGLVADVAAAKHITLAEAAGLVAKVLGGTGGKTLAAYGIHIDKTKDKTQEATRALDEWAKKVHGQASASADTFSGRLEGLRTHLENAFNAIGAKAGPALTYLGTALGAVGSIIEIFGAAKAALATRAATRLAAAQTEAAAAATRLGEAETVAAAGTTEAAAAATAAAGANERLGGSSVAAGGGMSSLAKGAGGVAAAFIAFEAVSIFVDKVSDAMIGAVPGVHALTNSILDLANSGKATGPLLKEFGPDLNNVGRELGYLNDKTYRAFSAVGLTSLPLKKAREEFSGIDAALAGLVTSGHANEAADAFDRLTSAAVAQGHSVADVVAATPGYQDALAGVKPPVDDTAAALRRAADAAGYLGRSIDTLSGRLNIDKAIISTADAARALSKSIKDNGKDFSDLTVKGGANKTALIAVAEGYAQIRDAQIKNLTPTRGLTAATNAANVAYAKNVAGLRALLSAAGLTKPQIDKLIGSIVALNATPPPKIPVSAPGLDTTARGMQALHNLIMQDNGRHVVIHFDQLFSSSGNRYATGASDPTLGGILSGSNHRAGGGRVKRGQSYIVGENRPELFTADADGMISPSVPSGGSGGAGGADPAGLAQALTAAMTGMVWQLKIDPQGLATVVAAGNRSLGRRG